MSTPISTTLSDIRKVKVVKLKSGAYVYENLDQALPEVGALGTGLLVPLLVKLLGDVHDKLTWYDSRLKKLETPPAPPKPAEPPVKPTGSKK